MAAEKTKVPQVSPLTPAARAIFDEIRAEQKRSKVQPLLPLVFTRDDGKSPISGSMVDKAMLRASVAAGLEPFRFHDARHTCITRWSSLGVATDIAMLASGHRSVAMHNHYTHLLKTNAVARTFGTEGASQLRQGSKDRTSR